MRFIGWSNFLQQALSRGRPEGTAMLGAIAATFFTLGSSDAVAASESVAPDAAVDVRIPASVLPFGKTFHVAPGTRIYVLPEYLLTKVSVVDGLTHSESWSDPSLQVLGSVYGRTLVRRCDGSISFLGADTSIANAFRVLFITPKMQIPVAIRGIAPTAVAPLKPVGTSSDS